MASALGTASVSLDAAWREARSITALSDAKRGRGPDPVDRFGIVRYFEPEATLFDCHAGPGFHVELTSGVLRIAIGDRMGRRQILAFMFPGGVLSTRWLAGDAWAVEAVTAGTLVACPLTVMNQIVEDHPGSARQSLLATERQLAGLLEQCVSATQHNAAGRIARFLMHLARRLGVGWSADGTITLELPMGRRDIADHLGLTVETVSRELTGMRRQKLIDLPSAPALIVLRVRDLELIAEGGETRPT